MAKSDTMSTHKCFISACFEYYGGVAGSIVGHHVKLPSGSWGFASREPLGVVGKLFLTYKDEWITYSLSKLKMMIKLNK